MYLYKKTIKNERFSAYKDFYFKYTEKLNAGSEMFQGG